MDSAGKPLWCDPDYWPVARQGGEQANAIAKYPEIKGEATVYEAIVAHEHLPSGELTDAQKLVLYRAWKLLRPVQLNKDRDQYFFEYTVMSPSDRDEKVTGTVRADGVVTVQKRTPAGPPNCPICLAASTMIATPAGLIPVTAVRVGTVVWTQAPDGSRVAAPVVKAGSMLAPAGHMVVHVVLADGRSLLVSPGHPTADRRTFGSLRLGDTLDGSAIATWELVPYGGERTYDLLPAGGTGLYWAGGILVGSTLSRSAS